MNVAIGLFALGFPCIGLLVLAALAERFPTFARWCDVVAPPKHRGRL